MQRTKSSFLFVYTGFVSQCRRRRRSLCTLSNTVGFVSQCRRRRSLCTLSNTVGFVSQCRRRRSLCTLSNTVGFVSQCRRRRSLCTLSNTVGFVSQCRRRRSLCTLSNTVGFVSQCRRRRSLCTLSNTVGFVSQCRRRRSLCTLSNTVDSVLVEEKGSCRTVTLNRPSILNALNYFMVSRLFQLYKSWEDDPAVRFVVLKGNGRAFCSGGDVVQTYNLIKKGNIDECKEFYRKVYSIAYVTGIYSKPQVALLNGITMGGGAAISIPGTFRVATEKTVFANPETLIGLHPDAGASFYLSRLPGYLGEYLGLTGDKLSGEEMMSCGLATHYSLSERLPLIEEQLGKLITDDPSVIESSLAKFGDIVHPDQMSVLKRIETVNKIFSHETVEEIVDCLESEVAKTADAWCISTLKRLREISPLSLKVSLRSIREGRFQTLEQCIIREYRMTLQAFFGQITHDYCEGVRARIVDKDLSPKWNPPSLEHVTNDMVDEYFSPLTAVEPDLELPTQQKKAVA